MDVRSRWLSSPGLPRFSETSVHSLFRIPFQPIEILPVYHLQRSLVAPCSTIIQRLHPLGTPHESSNRHHVQCHICTSLRSYASKEFPKAADPPIEATLGGEPLNQHQACSSRSLRDLHSSPSLEDIACDQGDYAIRH